jgi:pimeloyl-ACP methyl ester carboxylesterase
VLRVLKQRRNGRQFARRSTMFLAVAGLVVSAVQIAGLGAANAGAPTGAPQTLHLGKVSLRKCSTGPLIYCGGLAVPLDYASKGSPDIHIGFDWLPATRAKHATGTVMAVEGGPGFATTGTEPEYAAMLGSLRQTRNLLLVNLRGTGNSTLVNCKGLQDFGQPQHQYGSAFNQQVAACGNQLDHTWKYANGRWVHAADLFNTAYSARDVSLVLNALRLGKIDLYGDSYGSWFSQVFASRYAKHLRSVTLDSTYQVLGLDPWYTTTVITARQAFEQACAESAACQQAASGQGAWNRISNLAVRLEHKPAIGQTVSPDGTLTKETVTVETLVNLINNSGFDPVVYQDLDAAARALLQDHDQAPLLRLAELSIGFDDTNYPLPEFSDGLYMAVSCTDYVQLFNRRSPPSVRASQYQHSLASEPAQTFAPFTVAQWTSLDQYTETYNGCLDWPTPTKLVAPITRKPPLVPASLPVLILSGTFDSLTPWLDGASLVASQVGKSARLVRFANLTHVMLQDGNDSCPAQVFQSFISHPGDLQHLNTSCASKVAPIHTVGSYPLRLSDAVPAKAIAGNTASPLARRAASTALAMVGDEISRFPLLDSDTDLGLRGGKISFTGGSEVKIKFTDVRWVANASISGTAQWNTRTGWVSAQLTVDALNQQPVQLSATWWVYGQQDQLAKITGSQGSTHLMAVAPPP